MTTDSRRHSNDPPPEPRQTREVGIGVIWRIPTGLQSPLEVLCARRKLTDTLGGFWEFPGGKIEFGESVLQCVVREIREETGLIMPSEPHRWSECVTFHPAVGTSAPRFHVIHSQAPPDQEPQPLESDICAWVTLADLRHLKFPEANRSICVHIQAVLAGKRR